MNTETYDHQCYECDKQDYKANELGDGFLVGCGVCTKYGCPETCFKWSDAHKEFLCESCWEEEMDYCNGCDQYSPTDTMYNHDDINLCPECNAKKPELIPVGCECERCEKNE